MEREVYQKGIQGIGNGKCMGKDRFHLMNFLKKIIESDIVENGGESIKAWFLH